MRRARVWLRALLLEMVFSDNLVSRALTALSGMCKKMNLCKGLLMHSHNSECVLVGGRGWALCTLHCFGHDNNCSPDFCLAAKNRLQQEPQGTVDSNNMEGDDEDDSSLAPLPASNVRA